jgi:hypothetical protein
MAIIACQFIPRFTVSGKVIPFGAGIQSNNCIGGLIAPGRPATL